MPDMPPRPTHATVPADLDAIRARLAAATPGPWSVGPKHVVKWQRQEGNCRVTTFIGETYESGEDGIHRMHANAALIAHAPTDLAALLATIARLERRVAVLRGLLKRAREELRLIESKDSGAIYDTLIRIEADAALAETEGE